jgi:pyruvate/2-oxoglutarate dehydrogenase complex dihydrolipoamide acyltransferase (E2) component
MQERCQQDTQLKSQAGLAILARMSPTDEALPSDATPDASTQTDETAADPSDAPSDPAVRAEMDPADSLSPSVRRLVRQFDLDITGIHGTGPSGRIRVGDVMGLLGGRKDSGARDAPARPPAPDVDAESSADDAGFEAAATQQQPAVEPGRASKPAAAVEPAAPTAAPATTVFECDLSRVLAHRRRLRRDNIELTTTSYFLTALAAALERAPELTAAEPVRFGVSLTTSDGRVRSSVLDVPDTLPASLDERVRAVDIALRANLHTPLEHSNLLVHHYGESGSLLATPTPVGAGHVGSVGIGRLRREVVVRVIDGVESPRIASCCHVSLSFLPDRVSFHDANRTLAAAVALLESWPH